MISEVYNKDSYAVVNALADMKEHPHHFSNMPRNVFHNRRGSDQIELEQRNHLDIAPALLLYLSQHYNNYSFYVKTREEYKDGGGSESGIVMRNIYVFDSGEAVGVISRGERYSNNQNGLEFENKRISWDLKRGSAKKTSKLNAAKSIFAKYFYRMTMREHMESLAAEIRYEVSNAMYNMRTEYATAERRLMEFLRKEVEQNNQLVMTCIETLGEASLIDSYNATQEAVTAAGNLEKLIENQKGYYVMLKDDEYISWRKGDSDALNQPKRLKREEMPENMRMALGLLKLAEPKTFVHEAGFKVSENKFFLLDEVQLEFDN